MSQLEDTGGQHGLVWTQRTLITVYASVMAVMVAAGGAAAPDPVPSEGNQERRQLSALCSAARSSVGISDCRNTTAQICFLCSEAGNAAAGINPNDFWSKSILDKLMHI